MRDLILRMLRRRVSPEILIDEKLNTVQFDFNNPIPWVNIGNERN